MATFNNDILRITRGPEDGVARFCAAAMGRPSIDPVVFFKLQLIMFFEGIRSERQLMERVKVNLAYRWTTGMYT
jgi:transposase